MNYLLVNTANDELVIMISKNGEIFACNETMVKRHNEVILPKMQELLDKANISLVDIDEFGVVIGPGSFTGIRVGIATLKAFKDVFNKPVKAINNLDLLYHIANANNRFDIVAIEGSMNSYFVGKFEQDRLNIYERNLTLDELVSISQGRKVAMYSNTRALEIGEVVKFDNQAFVQAFLNSQSYDLTPIYYQLSQAENDKIAHANIIVREAELYDVKAILQIANSCFSNHSLNISEADLLCKKYMAFVAQVDEQVVGFLLVDKSKVSAGYAIRLIVVDTNFRNHGIGTKLIERVEQLAAENNITVRVPIFKDCFSLETLCKKLNYQVDLQNSEIVTEFKNLSGLYKCLMMKNLKQG